MREKRKHPFQVGDIVAIKANGHIGRIVEWVPIAGAIKAKIELSGNYGYVHKTKEEFERVG